ncbi:hypothetical protein CVT25_007890 [Psilocybe cyanescens]|uniref:Uncharacterized protein n=1 Tax=Psilocybe cyanescens TaxID=93625 RepID=A0A409XTX6_PSICY|nr:hypothetical protein CVT25_007890 [Psilocybe cyanescens]
MNSEGSRQTAATVRFDHRWNGSLSSANYRGPVKSDRDPALCALVHKCAKKMYPSSVFDGLAAEESHAMRRKWIRAHLRNHHDLECTPGDMGLIGCPACPIVNGQMTHVERGAFPEHINLWHQPAATAGKPSTS